MQLLPIDLALVRDAPRNANRMSEDTYDALLESIRRVGYVQPILVTTLPGGGYEVVDGHHRVRALRDLGWSSAGAVVLSGTEDPRLVALALNRLRGETDLSVAGLVIEELLDAGIDQTMLAISGFSSSELEDLVRAMGDVSPTIADLGDADFGEERPAVVRPFVLELTFSGREDLTAAKRALRKAAGKGGDLADGLLRLVCGE